MNRTIVTRCIAAAAAAMLCAGLAATPTAARPDPGERSSTRFSSYDLNCSLARIGTQLVRCDNLTGAGVAAPGSVPML